MDHTTKAHEELLALKSLLNTSIDALLVDEQLPSLSDSTPGARPLLAGPGAVVSAAASQLIALIGGPAYTMSRAMGGHIASSLRVAIEAHVVEAIREAGEEGLHVDEIAKASEVDPSKLARILRLLAAHHIFTETALDTFANNRPSIVLDTGKSVAELKGDPNFYDGTNGFAALVAHSADDLLKATGYLSEAVLSPSSSHSDETTSSPWNLANRTSSPIWAHWAAEPDQRLVKRFTMAMLGASALGGGYADVTMQGGLDLAALRDGAVLVDVGGGAGAVSLVIAEQAPQIKIVVQDRPEVIEEAQKVWAKQNPSAIKSGRVKLVAHDFFTPQPEEFTGADVYLLRSIVHDWPTPRALDILKHLAAAAGPHSTLLVLEHVIDPLAPSAGNEAPYPLLPTGGQTFPYLLDLQMLCALNAQERTEREFRQLGEESGWRLERVVKGVGLCQILFHKVC